MSTADRTPSTPPRADLIREQLQHAAEHDLDGGDLSWVQSTGMLIVDALVEQDRECLEDFLDEAARVQARRGPDRALDALVIVAQWGMHRVLPAHLARAIDPRSARGRILRFVDAHPDCTSKELFTDLELAEATVARTGAGLESDGLVNRIKAGKWLRWRLTPLGRETVLGVSSDEPVPPRRDLPRDTTEAMLRSLRDELGTKVRP